MANNTDVGSLEQGQITITPSSKDEYVENCYDLVEDTVVFTSAIDEVVEVAASSSASDHEKVITLATNPADASISATLPTGGSSYATATMGTSADANKLTITGVAAGSTIVTLEATKSGFASFKRTILIIVK